MTRTLLFVFILTALIAGCAQNRDVNVLIVTGGHGFEREQFFDMFNSFEGVTHKEAVHPNANSNYAADLAKDIDVFVFYDMNQDITQEDQNNFLQMAQAGKGLVFLHHSLANYQSWDKFLDIIGGRYLLDTMEVDGKEYPGSTYEHDVDMNIKVVGQHPVTSGLQDFTIHDEIYGGYWVSPKVIPLLKTDHPQSTETIAWTNHYGKSRIVTIQLGHDHFAWENDNYRKLLLNAIKWVGDH